MHQDICFENGVPEVSISFIVQPPSMSFEILNIIFINLRKRYNSPPEFHRDKIRKEVFPRRSQVCHDPKKISDPPRNRLPPQFVPSMFQNVLMFLSSHIDHHGIDDPSMGLDRDFHSLKISRLFKFQVRCLMLSCTGRNWCMGTRGLRPHSGLDVECSSMLNALIVPDGNSAQWGSCTRRGSAPAPRPATFFLR